jgi:hypothetical protein
VHTAAVLAALLLAAAAPPPRIGSDGVTVAPPAGWHTWRPLPGLKPNITDPVMRVVAISAPWRFAPRGCQVAAFAFPRDAVALVVVEWRDPRNAPGLRPRPRHFTSANLPLHPAPAIECWRGPGGAIEFTEHGRLFGAYLMAGPRAPRALIARARAVLDTLRVAPR